MFCHLSGDFRPRQEAIVPSALKSVQIQNLRVGLVKAFKQFNSHVFDRTAQGAMLLEVPIRP